MRLRLRFKRWNIISIFIKSVTLRITKLKRKKTLMIQFNYKIISFEYFIFNLITKYNKINKIWKREFLRPVNPSHRQWRKPSTCRSRTSCVVTTCRQKCLFTTPKTTAGFPFSTKCSIWRNCCKKTTQASPATRCYWQQAPTSRTGSILKRVSRRRGWIPWRTWSRCIVRVADTCIWRVGSLTASGMRSSLKSLGGATRKGTWLETWR